MRLLIPTAALGYALASAACSQSSPFGPLADTAAAVMTTV